jgi:hypothetical protein
VKSVARSGLKVGVVFCRVELDGLDDTGIAEGVVVVDGEDIDVDKWVVVELTSGNGRVVEMLLGRSYGERKERKAYYAS